VLRNRVLHGGYVPDRNEARSALDAADVLSKFIGDRILDRSNMFPRSALIVFGLDGLERRGADEGMELERLRHVITRFCRASGTLVVWTPTP